MSPGAPPLPARTGHCILVVDDDRRVVELMQVALGSQGYRVVAANNGEDALKMAVREQPDLVVLDVRLPRKSGLEVCEILRHDPEDPRVPIILVSALAETEVRVDGLARGADDFLTKPFSPKELLARIRRHLQRSEEHRELRRRTRDLENELARARDESRRHVSELRRERGLKEATSGVGRDLHRSLDPEAVAQNLLRAAQTRVGVSDAGLLLEGPPCGWLRPAYARGLLAEAWNGLALRAQGELVTLVAGLGRPVRLTELERFGEATEDARSLAAAGVTLVTPLASVRGLEGLLAVGERASGEDFDRASLETLAAIAEAGGVALHDAAQLEEWELRWLDLVSRVVERDEGARGNQGESRALARGADALGCEVGLDRAERARLRRRIWLEALERWLQGSGDVAETAATRDWLESWSVFPPESGDRERLERVLAAARVFVQLESQGLSGDEARARLAAVPCPDLAASAREALMRLLDRGARLALPA